MNTQTLLDNPDSFPVRLLIVGNPGTGKTSIALRFPRPFVIDCDNNIRPAAIFTRVACQYDRPNFTALGVSVPPEQRFDRLAEIVRVATADSNVDTIVIDSMTTLSDILISQAKRKLGRKDDAEMRIQDWGDFAYFTKNLFSAILSCNKHVVVTAHNDVEKDEFDKSLKLCLYFPGKSRWHLSALFTDVWETTVEQAMISGKLTSVRRISTVPRNVNDFRGHKNTFGLEPVVTVETAIEKLATLKPCKSVTSTFATSH